MGDKPMHEFKLHGAALATALAIGAIHGVTPAAAQDWGVQANSGIGDIAPGGGQNNFTFDFAGGAGVPIAETSIDDSGTPDAFGNGPHDRGTTRGFAGLTFAGNRPNPMKAEAILTGNRSGRLDFDGRAVEAIANSSVFVSDRFQYTGSSATVLSVTYTLEGEVRDPAGDNVANPLTGIWAEVAVFADTPDYVFFDAVGTLRFEFGAQLKGTGGNPAWDPASLVIDEDTGGAVATRNATLEFDVTPGETFWVWQTLTARAAFDTRLADAFSTLTGEFSEPGNVVSVSAIPLPASWMLALPALALAAGLRRRHT